MSDPRAAASLGSSREADLFAEFYRRHYRPIRDYCRRRLASDLVDEVVAETFLVAWRRFEDVPDGDEARLWLYRVAFRQIGHQYRSRRRRRRLEDRLRSMTAHAVAAADESVICADEYRLVLEAASSLGPTDAEMLRLVAWEQLSIVDAAAVVEISTNAAKQRLHRARRNLAREYRRLESRVSPTPDAPTGGAR